MGERWYDGGAFTKVSGVFEGGGAKGVGYGGALEQTRAEGIWFDAVAGASAGAITATLIAAGFEPHAIASKARAGLATLDNFGAGRLRYLRLARQLARRGHVLDSSGLEDWLATTLRERTGGDVDETTTFGSLFAVTNIELFVVAADVSRAGPVVFHHEITPDASVAAAVVASSSLPTVLAPRRLVVEEEDRAIEPKRSHVIVDGGVLSNFPEFVFKDRSFRSHFALQPQRTPVVGFILDEETNRPLKPTELRDAWFLPASAERAPARSEVLFAGEPKSRLPRKRMFGWGLLLSLFSFVCAVAWTIHEPSWLAPWYAPFAAALGAAGIFLMALATGSPEPNRFDPESETPPAEGYPTQQFPAWRTARAGSIAHLWQEFVSTHGGALVAAMLVLLFFGLARLPHAAWMSPAPTWRSIMRWVEENPEFASTEVGGDVVGYWMLPKVVVIVVVVAIVLLLAFAAISSVAAFLGFWLAGRFIAESGGRLGQTLLSGAGTTAWAGAHPDDVVVKIPIPATVTTTSFDLTDDVLSDLVNRGREAARGLAARLPAVGSGAHEDVTQS